LVVQEKVFSLVLRREETKDVKIRCSSLCSRFYIGKDCLIHMSMRIKCFVDVQSFIKERLSRIFSG
jgi:hypothetical protein